MTEVSLSTYIFKALLALIVLAVCGWCFVLVSKRKGWLQKGSNKLYVISSLSLVRDVFFVLRCGPEVIGIVTGPSGSRLIAKWNPKDWNIPETENNESRQT